MHNSRFQYQEHSVLVQFCDPRKQPVEMLVLREDDEMNTFFAMHRPDYELKDRAYRWEWRRMIITEDHSTDYAPFRRDNRYHQYLVFRVGDHPLGTNAACWGLGELADAAFQLTHFNEHPPRLVPDNAPFDLGHLLLPFRCICGRLWADVQDDVFDTPGNILA